MRGLGDEIADACRVIGRRWTAWKAKRWWKSLGQALGPEYHRDRYPCIIYRVYHGTLFMAASPSVSDVYIAYAIHRHWFPGCRGYLVAVDDSADKAEAIRQIEAASPAVMDVPADTLRITATGWSSLHNVQLTLRDGREVLFGRWIQCVRDDAASI